MERIQFRVYGRPATQGSKRVVAILRAGKPVMKNGRALTRAVEDNPRLAQWRQAVAQVAVEAYRGPLLCGPVCLTLVFIRPRPKSCYGTGRNAGRLKPGAPLWPTTRPDLLKLARAVEDALTGVIWRDDAQVVSEMLQKRYGERFAVHVTIELIEEKDHGTEKETGESDNTDQRQARLGVNRG